LIAGAVAVTLATAGCAPQQQGPAPQAAEPEQEAAAPEGAPEVAAAPQGRLSDLVVDLTGYDLAEARAAKQALVAAGEPGARAALPVALDRGEEIENRELAIVAVSEAGSPQTVAELVPLLNDPSESVRYRAMIALRNAFGQSFGYHYQMIESSRKAVMEQWREFLAGQGRGLTKATEGQEAPAGEAE